MASAPRLNVLEACPDIPVLAAGGLVACIMARCGRGGRIVDFTIVKTSRARKKPATSSAGTARGPVSVVLPSPLRGTVATEAKRRGLKLSTAIRVLVSERIRDIEEAEELTQAEQWQRAQAWATWEKIQSGDRREVSDAEIEAVFSRRTAPSDTRARSAASDRRRGTGQDRGAACHSS